MRSPRAAAFAATGTSPRNASERVYRKTRIFANTKNVREFSVNTASTLTCYKKRRCVSTFFCASDASTSVFAAFSTNSPGKAMPRFPSRYNINYTTKKTGSQIKMNFFSEKSPKIADFRSFRKKKRGDEQDLQEKDRICRIKSRGVQSGRTFRALAMPIPSGNFF